MGVIQTCTDFLYKWLSSTHWSVLVLTVLLGVTLLKAVHRWARDRGKNFPPGPRGVPVLGYFPFLLTRQHEKLTRLSKKYGDVFHVNLAGTDTVVLNSYESIKLAFHTRGKDFSGLPHGYSLIKWITNGAGIFQEEEELWKADRRFILQIFRDFGIGRQLMESKVQSVAEDLKNILLQQNGRPCDVEHYLVNSTANVLCSFMFDKHYQWDHPDFQQILKNKKVMIDSVTGAMPYLPMGPLLFLLPPYWKLLPVKKSMTQLVNKFIREHDEAVKSDEPRDYMDAYLQHMHKLEKSQSEELKYFSKQQLIGNAFDFLVAGVDTTSASMYWALWLLTVHPEMQHRIWKEVETVVGTQRMPSYNDRNKMPFFEAFLTEVQRYACIVPIPPLHGTLEETTLGEYTIPKHSTIMANLWAVHRDPAYWKDPDTFDPNRFLDQHGKTIKSDSFIPFSIGKRMCVGESLARMEIFIFTASLIQNFVLRAPDGVDLSTLEDNFSFVHVLTPYKLCAVPRT